MRLVLRLNVNMRVLQPIIALRARSVLLRTRELSNVERELVIVYSERVDEDAEGDGQLGLMITLVVIRVRATTAEDRSCIVLLRDDQGASKYAAPERRNDLETRAAFRSFVPASSLSTMLDRRLLRALSRMTLRSFLDEILTIDLRAFDLSTLLTNEAILPTNLETLIAASIRVLT